MLISVLHVIVEGFPFICGIASMLHWEFLSLRRACGLRLGSVRHEGTSSSCRRPVCTPMQARFPKRPAATSMSAKYTLTTSNSWHFFKTSWVDITFKHLADAFIQSDLQCIQVIIFFVSMCVPWELNPQPLRC